MDRLHKIVILVLVVGIPAAAWPLLEPATPLCFSAGPIASQLSPPPAAPDFRVRFDDGALHPNLRIAFVDSIATADFALVDDLGGGRNACQTALSLHQP
jgi:hypothetical protein